MVKNDKKKKYLENDTVEHISTLFYFFFFIIF